MINAKTIIYQTKSGAIQLRTTSENQTILATQAEIALIFDVNPQAITKHIKNIYKEGELTQRATCSKMEQVRQEGKRTITRTLACYNLDVIIAVGYRINSVLGTKFRQWATKTLKEHIEKGYTINRQRIKKNHDEFISAVEKIKVLLPEGDAVPRDSVLELIKLFADTWFSLDAYDKDQLLPKGSTKKKAMLTAEKLSEALKALKKSLIAKKEASNLFGVERSKDSISGSWVILCNLLLTKTFICL